LKSTLLILISSFGFDDNIGQTFAIYIIAIAGAESVIGLSILVAYYRLKIALLYNKKIHFIKEGFWSLRTLNNKKCTLIINPKLTNIDFGKIEDLSFSKNRHTITPHPNLRVC
jgi:hypothetical protein